MAGLPVRRLKMIRLGNPGAFARLAAFSLGAVFGAAVTNLAAEPNHPRSAEFQQAASAAAPVNIYTHARAGYRLFAPPDAKISESGDGLGLTITSPRGYVIRIKGGPTEPNVALAERVALFEAANLGPGKRWSKKLGEHATQVNGVSAFESLYEGENEAAHATMMRAGGMDYIFLFMTSPDTYKQYLGEFYAVVTSFQPPAAAPIQSAEQNGNGGAANKAAAPPAVPVQIDPASATPANAGRINMFAEAGFGLAASYPARWTSERPSRASVLFSGPEGSEAFYATVRVDRIALPPQSDAAVALDSAFANQKAQLNAGTRNPVFLADRRFRYDKQGLRLSGREMQVAFSFRNQRFRRWVVVLPRPASAEAFVWTFTAPDTTYDRYVDVAENILDSLTIDDPSQAARR